MATNTQTLDALVNGGVANKSIFSQYNKAILNPEQAGKFLRTATEDQVVLKEASVFTMKSHTKNLDRVEIAGRVLTSGYDDSGVTRELTDEEKATVTNFQNQLVAKKLKTQVIIEDDELEDNLEGKAFTNTLLDMLGQKVGYDMEVWAMHADAANISYVQDKLLHTTTGWLKGAGYQLYGKESTSGADDEDFNIYAEDGSISDPEALFDALIAAMPKKYIKNRTQMRFYVPYEIEKAYRDLLKQRGTALGDATIQGYSQLAYEDIPVVKADSLDDTTANTLHGSPAATLQNPANMQCGIWRQIAIEPDRNAKLEQTEYVLTMRGDVDYNNQFMAATAWYNKAKPGA